MKKLGKLKLNDNEMKEIVGGDNSGPTCTASLNCSGGSKSCSGTYCYSVHDGNLGIIREIYCMKDGQWSGRLTCNGNGYS